MKVIVNGAGFIGSHLTEKLLSKNFEIIVLDNLLRGNKLSKNQDINFINCNIIDQDKLNQYTKGCDIIFI